MACEIHKDVLLYRHRENHRGRCTAGMADLLQVSMDHPTRMEIIQAISDTGQLYCGRVLKSDFNVLTVGELTKKTRSASWCSFTYRMASPFGIHSVTIWNGSTITPKHLRIFW